MVSGPDAGRELPLRVGTYFVGTASEADLCLSDGTVSRRHLTVEVGQSSVRLTDHQSTNGSFCRGVRFTSIDASDGVPVRIGRTELKILPLESEAPVLPSQRERFGRLVGRSVAMRELFAVLERVAPTDTSVLVEGETGSGKDLCAHAIHENSARVAGPFVVCDLASIPRELVESELFGHVAGAFTGAVEGRVGAFESATGGTLLLDEIGEFPLDLQSRLLRVIEERQIRRVGSNERVDVDVRVLAATNRDLAAEVRAGRFRQDLYHRLVVVRVRVPPLRDRPEDLEILVDEVLRDLGKTPSELRPTTRALMAGYHWPGNVRELRNTLMKAVSLGIPGAVTTEPGEPERPEGAEAEPRALPMRDARERLMAAFERDYLSSLMSRCAGNLSQASRESRVDRKQLRGLLRRYGLR